MAAAEPADTSEGPLQVSGAPQPAALSDVKTSTIQESSQPPIRTAAWMANMRWMPCFWTIAPPMMAPRPEPTPP